VDVFEKRKQGGVQRECRDAVIAVDIYIPVRGLRHLERAVAIEELAQTPVRDDSFLRHHGPRQRTRCGALPGRRTVTRRVDHGVGIWRSSCARPSSAAAADAPTLAMLRRALLSRALCAACARPALRARHAAQLAYAAPPAPELAADDGPLASSSAVVLPVAEVLNDMAEVQAAAPRRRGRPKKTDVAVEDVSAAAYHMRHGKLTCIRG
jgi:hypothetical protein